MQKLITLLVLLLIGSACAESALDSGLKPGEGTPPHHPRHVTGPEAGTSICPV